MERRRFLGLAATGVAGAVGVTAAGCSGPGSGGVTLKLVAADYGDPSGGNGSQAYWDDLARAFTEKHPDISVDVTVHSWNDVDREVAGMVKDGNPPDLAQIGAYANYADQGKLYSASDLLSIPVQADFVPGLAEAGEVTRIQYGMPFVSSTRLLFYNRKLFTEAGLDPDAPPESWKELKQAATALKSAGVRIPYGLPLGPEEAPAETLMWMLTGGGSFTDDVGNYTIDSEENVRTFAFLRDELVGEGLTNGDPGGTDRQELFDAFSRGEVGMLNGHPTLIQQIARGDVEYATAVAPGADGPTKSTLGVADWMMAFNHNGRRKELGTFLDFVYSEKQHYAFVDRYDLLPVTVAARERMRRDTGHKPLWRFLDQLSGAEYYPVDKVSWARVSAKVKKDIGRAVRKDGSPKNVLGSLQRVAEAEESAARG